MTQLLAFLSNIVRLSAWLALLVLVFVPLERLFAVHRHKVLRQGVWTDLCYYFINSLVPAALLSFPAALLASTVRHFAPHGLLAFAASLPFWGRALAAFAVGEIGYYWGHRWSHEIPFLWRFHSVHHSAEEMDFLVNTRAHPLDMVFSRLCELVPIYALGLAGPAGVNGGATMLVVVMIGTLWGFLIHANVQLNLGPLALLLSSPKFHHWHHTRTGPIDRNYASMFPWLDRLFGTYYVPAEWPESYGIEAEMPATLIDQLSYPFLPAEADARLE